MPADTRTISVYLLKPEVRSALDAFKPEAGDLRQHTIEAGDTTGTLFVRVGFEATPDWVEFLSAVADPPLEDRTRGLSAVLVMEAADRWFAITFGHARHLLDPEAYERDFGLYCALNGVDPERLRGAEARTFDEYALHTLRQLSRLSSLGSLELNTDRELVVSLAGQLENADIGKKVDGRDAVRLTAVLGPSELREKCEELLQLSEGSHYLKRFPFFDTIKRVRDPEEIRRLEHKALTALGQQSFEEFDLFPPQIVSDEIVVFRVVPIAKGLTTVVEPDSQLLRYPIRGPQSPQQVRAALDRFRLQGVDANGGVVDEWTFRKCLHWEIADGGAVYVLDSGEWYRVAGSLVSDVEAFARELKPSGISWPDATVGQREDAYNEGAASDLGFALLDKQCVRLPGQSEIEACDLFTRQRQFIHVKHRKGGSGPLSHLFAQAVVSAECFVSEPEYRRLLRKELESAKTGFGAYSPEKVDSANYSVVLALITTPSARGRTAEKLPFFSKVMLRLAVRRLKSMGFDVYLDAISTRVSGPTGLPVRPAKSRKKKGARGKVAQKPRTKVAAPKGRS